MRALSLFSGIGGLDLAAEWAGIETAAFCEYADFPRQVLRKHWPNVPIYKDIRKLNKKILLKDGVIDRDRTIGLVHGGFPCQPYSVSGEQKGKEDDRDLWPEMSRVVEELRPNWVVGENVANFANMELDRTISDLENFDYQTTTFVLPALAVGAEHQRLRTFVVANSYGIDVERCSEIQIPWGGGLSREFHARSFEEINRRSAVYQPRLCRAYNGIPDQVDRVKSLGNAVVPQQAYPIFAAIMEIERMVGDEANS
ncbi:MAG: DNA cytosine methyltransferase [Enterococcus avium]